MCMAREVAKLQTRSSSDTFCTLTHVVGARPWIFQRGTLKEWAVLYLGNLEQDLGLFLSSAQDYGEVQGMGMRRMRRCHIVE